MENNKYLIECKVFGTTSKRNCRIIETYNEDKVKIEILDSSGFVIKKDIVELSKLIKL